VLAHLPQITNLHEKQNLVHRLSERTRRFLGASSKFASYYDGDGESVGFASIVDCHATVLEQLADLYQSSSNDSYEADDILREVAELRKSTR
jgi:hypothetical protein